MDNTKEVLNSVNYDCVLFIQLTVWHYEYIRYTYSKFIFLQLCAHSFLKRDYEGNSKLIHDSLVIKKT